MRIQLISSLNAETKAWRIAIIQTCSLGTDGWLNQSRGADGGGQPHSPLRRRPSGAFHGCLGAQRPLGDQLGDCLLTTHCSMSLSAGHCWRPPSCPCPHSRGSPRAAHLPAVPPTPPPSGFPLCFLFLIAPLRQRCPPFLPSASSLPSATLSHVPVPGLRGEMFTWVN